MVSFPFASSIQVFPISTVHFACISRSSIIIRLPCALPCYLWKQNLELYLCHKFSVITCESEPLIFVTPKYWTHRLTVSEGLRRSTFADERSIRLGESLHVAERVTSLAVVSIRYDCRHWYLWFDTFAPSTTTSLAMLRQLCISFARGFWGSLCSDVFVR
jgi:hypothetical protein